MHRAELWADQNERTLAAKNAIRDSRIAGGGSLSLSLDGSCNRATCASRFDKLKTQLISLLHARDRQM